MSSARVNGILNLLDEKYGDNAELYKDNLSHNNPWQLLVATILSAQCTDARVNQVTPSLFKKYKTPRAFAKAEIGELEKDIFSCGFYHNKAKNIILCAKAVCDNYNGEVPRDLKDLLTLPGVGRKTANVIRGNCFNDPSIVVDTHVGRISRRLGLTDNTDPEKVEFDLMKKLPRDHWILWNLQLINFGRQICKSQSPLCSECFLKKYCKYPDKK